MKLKSDEVLACSDIWMDRHKDSNPDPHALKAVEDWYNSPHELPPLDPVDVLSQKKYEPIKEPSPQAIKDEDVTIIKAGRGG